MKQDFSVIDGRSFSFLAYNRDSNSLFNEFVSKQVKGQLEFYIESPKEIVSRFEKEGCENMLVAGGPHVATSFLKEQLIDELWLTIEPKIFGEGSNFALGEKLDISLRLLDFAEVNQQGTLITRYAVLKN